MQCCACVKKISSIDGPVIIVLIPDYHLPFISLQEIYIKETRIVHHLHA